MMVEIGHLSSGKCPYGSFVRWQLDPMFDLCDFMSGSQLIDTLVSSIATGSREDFFVFSWDTCISHWLTSYRESVHVQDSITLSQHLPQGLTVYCGFMSSCLMSWNIHSVSNAERYIGFKSNLEGIFSPMFNLTGVLTYYILSIALIVFSSVKIAWNVSLNVLFLLTEPFTKSRKWETLTFLYYISIISICKMSCLESPVTKTPNMTL